MHSWVGETLLDRYRVGAQIGRGGMGAVYAADDLRRPGWKVAIKHPLRAAEGTPGGLSDQELKRRFHAEVGKLIALGEIPGIVRIDDQGEHEGTPFYVMRFLTGGSLDQRLEAGAQSPGEVVAWARPIAQALDRLHARTPMLVHRDVKPQNILFDAYEQPHLADFGIVKELAAAWATTGAAQNTGLGTPLYMAPEQVLPDGVVDGRTDQYALAATMYQALTGSPPRYETTGGAPRAGVGTTGARAAVKKRLTPVHDVARHVPAAASAAISRGLAKDQDERFDTCAALVTAFERGLAAHVSAPARGPEPRVDRTRGVPREAPAPVPPVRAVRRRGRIGALLLVLGLLGAGGYFAYDRLVAGKPRAGQDTTTAASGATGGSRTHEPPTPPTLAKDTIAPIVTVTAPGDESVVTAEASFVVKGSVADGGAPLTGLVLRDGEATVAVAADGTFAHEVPLRPEEERSVLLVATDAAGNASVGVLRKVRRHAPTALEAIPAWAVSLVSDEQKQEAARLGKPVVFEEPTTGMRFVLIPGGTFTMGAAADEEGSDDDEGPQHQVTLSPFYLAIHEVTNAQYRRKEARHESGTKSPGDVQPAVKVSHDGATAYVKWLSDQGQVKGYRLPSEAQWEYACRAGTRTPFHFGATISTAQANYNGNYTYGDGVTGEDRRSTVEVGTLPPNRWGLFEVHGNVWEWCSDWKGAYGPQEAKDPEGPASGTLRVLRGGGWALVPRSVRSAYRGGLGPGIGLSDTGFRVALPASALPGGPAPSPVIPTDSPAGEAPLSIPAWAAALVSDEQKQEAVRLKKPVAFEEPTTGMRFVLIPGGTFTMGSPESEEGRSSDEGPQHQVTLSPFYLSIHEVTNAQYRTKEAAYDSGTRFNGDAQPVVGVNHDGATTYVRWLAEQARVKGYRLPSEAQWEYACRSGTTTPFHFGATISTAQANYDGDHAYGKGGKGEFRRATVNVGSLPPNRWGLFEVHGNVGEWCSDGRGDYGSQVTKDPEGPASGTFRVLRGGSWANSPGNLRSAYRGGGDRTDRFDDIGFRVALPVSAL